MSERKVATDALETLGTIIDENQKRDAIHLAVEPVIASKHFAPGDHITVKGGIAYAASAGEGLGIVDPFLLKSVKKGERFWFVMYPGKVHSLRHVWTHPEFPDVASTEVTGNKAASEAWIRNLCSSWDGPDYETLMELLNTGSAQMSEYSSVSMDEEYIYVYGSDAHGSIPSELWDHAEIVLGKKLTQRPSYLSCSC